MDRPLFITHLVKGDYLVSGERFFGKDSVSAATCETITANTVHICAASDSSYVGLRYLNYYGGAFYLQHEPGWKFIFGDCCSYRGAIEGNVFFFEEYKDSIVVDFTIANRDNYQRYIFCMVGDLVCRATLIVDVIKKSF